LAAAEQSLSLSLFSFLTRVPICTTLYLRQFVLGLRLNTGKSSAYDLDPYVCFRKYVPPVLPLLAPPFLHLSSSSSSSSFSLLAVHRFRCIKSRRRRRRGGNFLGLYGRIQISCCPRTYGPFSSPSPPTRLHHNHRRPRVYPSLTAAGLTWPPRTEDKLSLCQGCQALLGKHLTRWTDFVIMMQHLFL
jgi:hypothetical protein